MALLLSVAEHPDASNGDNDSNNSIEILVGTADQKDTSKDNEERDNHSDNTDKLNASGRPCQTFFLNLLLLQA